MDVSRGFRALSVSYLKSGIDLYFNNRLSYNMDYYESNSFLKNPDYSYDIYLISSLSHSWNDALLLMQKIRKSAADKKIIVGGMHITMLPELLPVEADFGLMGEAEYSLPELLDLIISDRISIQKLEKIKGLVYRKEGVLKFNEIERIPDEKLILPDRRYADGAQFNQYILSTRGCPYCCTFCSSSNFWKKVTYYSPQQIAEEIEEIIRLKPETKHIAFYDDLFIADRNRMRELAKILRERRIIPGITLSCSVRANLVDEELISILKDLNVIECGFGFESGSDRILKLLKPQGNLSVQKNLDAIKILKSNGIRVSVQTVTGVPTETEKELTDTLELLCNLMKSGMLDSAAFNVLMPLPGTKYWEWALEHGFVQNSNEYDWNRLRYFADYQSSKCTSFDEWYKLRRENGSLYLNADCISEKKFFKILKKYSAIRCKILRSRGTKNIFFRIKREIRRIKLQLLGGY